MTEPKASKNHHFVPQFLQNLFLGADSKQLWRYPLDGGQPEAKRPEKLLFQIRRNTAPDFLVEHGERPDELEHIFRPNEFKTAEVLKEWNKPGRPVDSEDEKAIVAFFLACLVARVPAAEENAGKVIDKWADSLTSLSQVADFMGYGPGHPYREHFARLEVQKPAFARAHLSQVKENFRDPYMRRILILNASINEAFPILLRSTWKLQEADESSNFLLSDNPAFYVGNKDLLYCPVGRKLCVCIADHGKNSTSTVSREPVGRDFVLTTNRLAISVATQWVVAHEESEELRRLIAEVRCQD